MICTSHVESWLVPVYASIVTDTESPPYTGLCGKLAYKAMTPRLTGVARTGAAIMENDSGDAVATVEELYAIDTTAEPEDAEANHEDGAVTVHAPTPVDADVVHEPLAELAPAVTDMDALKAATDVRPKESATEYTTDSTDESTYIVDVLRIATTLAGAFDCTA